MIGYIFEQFRSLRRFPVPVAFVLMLTVVVNLEITFLSKLTTLETAAIYALAGAALVP